MSHLAESQVMNRLDCRLYEHKNDEKRPEWHQDTFALVSGESAKLSEVLDIIQNHLWDTVTGIRAAVDGLTDNQDPEQKHGKFIKDIWFYRPETIASAIHETTRQDFVLDIPLDICALTSDFCGGIHCIGLDMEFRHLSIVAQFLEHHHGTAPAKIAKPIRSIKMHRIVENPWDVELMEPLSTSTIFQIINTAHALHIQSLVELGCAKIATLIRGKSPDEIRRILSDGGENVGDSATTMTLATSAVVVPLGAGDNDALATPLIDHSGHASESADEVNSVDTTVARASGNWFDWSCCWRGGGKSET